MKTEQQHQQSRSWRFVALLSALLASGIVINVWNRVGEAHVERHPLREFPTQLGAWRQVGTDERFDAETESVLRADDYIARNYVLPDNRIAGFYVGYYATQRNGATYHSPLNCLPGSGWTMSDPAKILITPASGAPAFEANRYIIQNGASKQLLVYWYQGRGRAVASEYRDKVYTVLDSVFRRRSDGAMVRVMTSVGNSETEATEAAIELAAQTADRLPDFVPE